SEGGESDINLLEGSYNLTSPLHLILSRYQDYSWQISAVQNIERYFSVEGQIGESVIDAAACRVIVTVAEGTDLSSLHLEKIKLGPEGITTITPSLQPGIIDLSSPLRVEVTCHGRSEFWTIYADVAELLVNTTAADPWSRVVWVYGACPSDMKGGFQYRKADSTDWISVPESDVKQTDGAFSVCIPHLEPLTEYVVRAVADGNIGNEMRVTTDATADIPDGDFDQWWLKNNKIWCPWNENGQQFWDTGNTGAATLGQSNVVPTDHTVTGQGQAAELNTRFVGIAGIGKLAAGSIYTGSFKRVDGTNGILDFGQPWKLRPTKLKGYYQYKTAPINYANADFKPLIGQPDTCHIYVALADWTAPFEIRTNPKNQQLFDKDSPSIIAYGELVYSGTMEEYQPFEIKLDYRSTSRIPTYLQITCAASKLGDYFTGGAGAVLYVDQFSFDYDY
ncbi:MAG: PCMD domain-containing protein, partial [Muribaculaceae bacterium]|nr:PCMD domain-containing protein [Muribaculaceae bacterium]